MTTTPGSPADRLLTASLFFAPVLYLLADGLYALRGWDSPAAGVAHVLGAIAYAFVFLRVTGWTTPTLAAILLVVSQTGMAGNVAYGFNTIHVSLGDTDLVDASGAAALIKPLGLFFPLALLLTAAALRRTAPPWVVATIGVAAVIWPVAHIANIGWLAVLVNLSLVAGFGMVATTASARTSVAATA
jgi:hypothetical protein